MASENHNNFMRILTKMTFIYLALERGYRVKMVDQNQFEFDKEDDEVRPTNQLVHSPTSL